MSGLYTYVGTSIDNATAAWITNVSSSMISAITPIILITLTCWVMWYGYTVTAGLVQAPVMDFMLKLIRIALVLSVALGVGNYQSFAVAGVQGLINGLAQIFWPTSTSLYGALDAFNDKAGTVAMGLVDQGSLLSTNGLAILFAGLVMFAGAALVAVFALVVLMVAKIAVVFLLAIGPAFIACLAFPAAADYFSKWFSKLLNYAVLQGLLVGACGLFMQISQHFIDGISAGGTGAGSGTSNPVADAFDFLASSGVLAVVLWQLPNITAGLIGGIALATGGQAAASMATGAAGLAARAFGKGAGAAAGGGSGGGSISGSGGSSAGGSGTGESKGVPMYRSAAMDNIARQARKKPDGQKGDI